MVNSMLHKKNFLLLSSRVNAIVVVTEKDRLTYLNFGEGTLISRITTAKANAANMKLQKHVI